MSFRELVCLHTTLELWQRVAEGLGDGSLELLPPPAPPPASDEDENNEDEVDSRLESGGKVGGVCRQSSIGRLWRGRSDLGNVKVLPQASSMKALPQASSVRAEDGEAAPEASVQRLKERRVAKAQAEGKENKRQVGCVRRHYRAMCRSLLFWRVFPWVVSQTMILLMIFFTLIYMYRYFGYNQEATSQWLQTVAISLAISWVIALPLVIIVRNNMTFTSRILKSKRYQIIEKLVFVPLMNALGRSYTFVMSFL